MFCDLIYAIQAEGADRIDCAALSAGVDFSKQRSARQQLDDQLNEPVGRTAEGFAALRKFLSGR